MPGENVTQQQLRTGRGGRDPRCIWSSTTTTWWPGHRQPADAAADLLPHAKDLGLHVVVARRSGGAARAMFDPVLARLRDLGCMGLMMSAAPTRASCSGRSGRRRCRRGAAR